MRNFSFPTHKTYQHGVKITNKMNKTNNLIKIHIAVLLFGLAGLFPRWLDLSALTIVFGRVFFASISLVVILKAAKQPLLLSFKRDYWFLGFMGILLAVHWLTFFQSILMSTVSIGLLTYSTFPVFMVVMEFLISKKWPPLIDLALALLSLLGVSLVVPAFEFENQYTQGAIWGVASGFTFACLALMNKKYAGTYSSRLIALYQDASATLVLLPLVLYVPEQINLTQWAILFLLGTVFTAFSHSLFISGLKVVKARTAGIIGTMEPVYGIVAAAILFHEIPHLREIAGGCIILAVALVAGLRERTQA